MSKCACQLNLGVLCGLQQYSKHSNHGREERLYEFTRSEEEKLCFIFHVIKNNRMESVGGTFAFGPQDSRPTDGLMDGL